MEINVRSAPIQPEVPKVLDNEQINVYVPFANTDYPGIASYNPDHFEFSTDNPEQVSIKEKLISDLDYVRKTIDPTLNNDSLSGTSNNLLETNGKTIILAINELHSVIVLHGDKLSDHDDVILLHIDTLKQHGETINTHDTLIGDDNSGLIKQANDNRLAINNHEERLNSHDAIFNTPIKSKQIGENEIKTINIADKSVTTDKLSNGSVTNEKIAERSITTSKIQDASISNTKYASGSITQDKLSSALNNKLLQIENETFTDVSYNSETGVLSFLTDGGREVSVDLPLELIVSGGRYDVESKDMVLVLANGDEINIPLDDLTKNVIDYVDNIKESIFVLQKAPRLVNLTDAILLTTPTLAAIAGIYN